ncbi:anti-sigma factor family protein [Trebonia kvetii]|uniref:anti-sigma factor family protein n=1 Tax=Trebonia kvetii TaxID=2480626 RepID=UPI001C9E75BC|nr:zf-HC2 domain-containing protein [Trebonia kvetii]
MDCAETRLSLGVYVLGAIDPAERALVDAHLATCRDCRDELASLAGLPALLARVSPAEAFALAADESPHGGANGAGLARNAEPPRELLATVLDLTAARQRRRRWWSASLTVAAALIIAVGVFGGLRLGLSPAQNGGVTSGAGGTWETVTGHSAGMTATVKYRSVGWGTQLDTEVTGIPIGTNCQLWVVDAAGHRVLAGSWLTDYDEGTVWYPASAAMNANDVESFQITVGKKGAIAVKAD